MKTVFMSYKLKKNKKRISIETKINQFTNSTSQNLYVYVTQATGFIALTSCCCSTNSIQNVHYIVEH